jgi:methanogenic corrinoid protein MtbC1
MLVTEGKIMAEDLVKALAELREKDAIKTAEDRLNAGDEPISILGDARRAMEIVGKRFEACEYFIPDLIYAGEILNEIAKMVKPKLVKTEKEKTLGKFLMGTVAGDIHDIGKNIVTFMLELNGFDVHDLGVDVPPQRFIEEIERFEPDIVGLSGFLTLAYDAMKETIQAIERAGLREKVKIMIGGGVLDESIVGYVGADGFEPNAGGAVSLAKKWIRGGGK